MKLAIELLAAGVAAGCATTQRPVLCPNTHLKTVGDAAARRDINDCLHDHGYDVIGWQ